MPRQLRHDVEGGWYHITTRGMWRKDIFENDRDREHFIELLSMMVEGGIGVVFRHRTL